jgi:hypothetical protein
VTVTVVPQGLPPQCGPESGPAVVDGQSFAIELDVGCNGPYEIQVVAESAGDTASGEPHPVGVAEPPPRPAPPRTEVTGDGGLHATWDPGDDPDADGTTLVVDFREDLFGAGIGEAILPPTDRGAAVAVRALRWGAGGPGTTISSPESGGTCKPTPSGTTPPSTTVPAGPSEAQPAAATVAAWPETSWRPWSDAEERAVPTATAGRGLVRTSDERPPGRVAPLALALLIITIAAVIAWRSGRTRPRSWGDRIPPMHRRQFRGVRWADLPLMAHGWTDLGLVTGGRPTTNRRVTSGTGSPSRRTKAAEANTPAEDLTKMS